MKVLMAEDLDSVRDHLSRLLAAEEGMEVRFVPQEATGLLLEAATYRPDVAIFDLRLRGGMTLAVLQAVKSRWPRTAVVVSASLFHPYYRTAFLNLGADLFFDKTCEWRTLVAFLRGRRAALAAEAEPALADALTSDSSPRTIL